MCVKLFSAILIAGCLSGSLWAGPQDQNPGGGIEKQLQSQFVPTRLAADRVKVAQAGTVLVVQKEGIGALSPTAGISSVAGTTQTFYPNNYKSGTVKHNSLAGMMLQRVGAVRDLEVNEKVYLIKMEMKDSAIVFDVQSCGSCDPKLVDPEHVPARAAVAFQFPKGYLDSANASQVETVISHVFAPSTDAGGPGPQNTSPDQQQAAARQPAAEQNPPAPLPPIVPPAPPPDTPEPPPAEVRIGQTPGEVVAALGQPGKVFKVGAKEIYLYKSLKVTFLNGKVSDIE